MEGKHARFFVSFSFNSFLDVGFLLLLSVFVMHILCVGTSCNMSSIELIELCLYLCSLCFSTCFHHPWQMAHISVIVFKIIFFSEISVGLTN